MIAQSKGRRVAEYDCMRIEGVNLQNALQLLQIQVHTWSQRGVQYIHHGIVVDMGNVHHHPKTVHFPHNPLDGNLTVCREQYYLESKMTYFSKVR